MSAPTPRIADALLAEAALAWPSLQVPLSRFRAFVESRLEVVEAAPARLAELYLCCASLEGDAAAIGHLDATYLAELPAVLAAARLPTDTAEEATAILRERLFFAPPEDPSGRPRLAEYRGQGELRAWLRVVATRVALDLLRRSRKEQALSPELADSLRLESDDPELAHLKQLYRDEFRLAFEEALKALTPRERNLLRHHLLGELSIDQLGSIYRVHRATAARWLDAARVRLVREIHDRLMSRLRTDGGDVDSILRLIRSQIDVSLRTSLTDREE